MADQKISDMSAAAALAGTELVELVQSGTNVRSTVAALAAVATGSSQPLDSDLTAIAALSTTALGRSLLEAANAAALRVLADSPSNAEAILDVLVDAKGDLLVGTAADTPGRLASGTQGQVLMVDTATASGLAWVARPELAMAPTGTVVNTYPRNGARLANTASLASGTLVLQAFFAPIGVTITNIVMQSGGTAAVAPTNWWFGVLDSARLWLRLTADQTSTAWAAQTQKSVALTSPWVTTYTGLHYFGVMMAAGTVVSLHGVDVSILGPASTAAAAPQLFGTSNTGLTTPPSTGTTANAIVAGSAYVYIWAT